MNEYFLCSTSTSTADIRADIESMLKLLLAHEKRPKPLSVIYATPEGIARLPKAPPPPAPCKLVFPPQMGLGIRIVQCATVDECQDALDKSIANGEHAAMLTESVYFDPIEAAREARL